MKPRICVLGSVNMDLLIQCDQLPDRGETRTASNSDYAPGGKGANQAVAAARLGADVTMIGRVGDDAFAETLIANLNREGIHTQHVASTDNCPSGYAVVAVETSGENQIIVVPGANGRVTIEDVESAREAIAASDMLLLQLEVPHETVAAAISIANEVGTTVMLDPAPSPAPAEWMPEFDSVDFLCPNESEAAAITCLAVNSIEDALAAAKILQQRTSKVAIITLGESGAVVATADTTQHIHAPEISPIDTTAAGDTFAGAFAVHLATHSDIPEAIRFANTAASIACTKPGAQTGMPTHDELK